MYFLNIICNANAKDQSENQARLNTSPARCATVKTNSKQFIKVIDSKISVLINNFIFLITFLITDFQGLTCVNNDMKRKRESLKVFVVFFK